MTELKFFLNVKRCTSSLLEVNEACLILKSTSEKTLQLSAQTEECYSCDYKPLCTVGAQGNASFIVETNLHVLLRYPFNVSKWCSRNVTFQEYGVYGWNISDDVCSDLYIIEEPVSQYLPLIVAAVLLIFLGILSSAFSAVVESRWFTNLRRRGGGISSSEMEKDLASQNPGDAPRVMSNEVPQNKCQRKRVVSLDVFRGLCIAMMIFVHAGGGSYWFFRLSVWNGLTATDPLFPWFLWIMGMSLAISLHTQLRSNKPRLHVICQVLHRSFVLIALGVIFENRRCGNKVNIKALTIPGIFQTLGVCYMVPGVIESLLMSREVAFRYGRWIVLSDIMESWRQWLLILALTGAHFGILLALPVPGCPQGYLGPGGWHMHGQYPNCTGGAAGYIDRLIFTTKHINFLNTHTYIYHTNQPFNCLGIVPTLTQILMVYLGVHAGRIMQCYKDSFARISRWCSWGLVTGIIAGILCNFSKEGGIIPVNRNLSSLSCVLANASMAFILLSILYFLVDSHRWWSGAPFIYAGRNALLLFFGHWITINFFPWTWQPIYNNRAEILAMNIWSTTLWLIIAYFLYCRNCFITI